MARTYRKTAADAVEDGKKLKRMDRRHGTAVVADGAQCHSTAADIYACWTGNTSATTAAPATTARMKFRMPRGKSSGEPPARSAVPAG